MKKEKPEKNYLKYIYIITGVFIFCFLVFCVIFGESYFNLNKARIGKINQFEISGTYQSIGDDTVYNFDDYSDIEAGKDGVIITGIFNGYNKSTDDLIVFVSNMQINIYANDNLIYVSKDEEITRYDIVPIRKSIEDGAEIRIELIPLQGIYYTYTYQDFFENLYIGDTYVFTLMKVKNNVPLIIFCRKEIFCSADTCTYFRICLMEIPFRLLGQYNTWFTRYTRCSQIVLVIFIPLILSRIENRQKRLMLGAYYILWYIFYFAYYAIVNDQGDSLPYVWIFS